MSPRARLAAAVHRYMAALPWTIVQDYYHFGLDDRTDGRWGCASIMGNAGLQFGLNVLFGATGFALAERLSKNLLDHSTLAMKPDGVTFMLDHVTLSNRKSKGMERYLVEKKKFKAGQARGYPVAWRLKPGTNPSVIGPEDALFLARCLEAVAQLAESKTLGTDALDENGRRLFYTMTDDASSVSLEKGYRRLEAADVSPGKIVLDAELLASLRSRPRHDGRYYLTIFSPVASIKGGKLIWAAMLLDEHEHIGTSANETFEAAALGVFRKLLERVPREIWTDSLQVFEALLEPLTQIGVLCVMRGDLPRLAATREWLDRKMQGPPPRRRGVSDP